jgi:hypothetical protein
MDTRATVSLTLSCTETGLSTSFPDVSPRQGQVFKGMPYFSLEPLHRSKFCSQMLCFETPKRALYEPLNASLDAIHGPLFLHMLAVSVHDKVANLRVS